MRRTQMTVNELIEIAKSQIGVKENPPNSNNVKYNTWFYGKEVSGSQYPWCAAFVSWLFRFNQTLCPKTASCANMLEWFEKKGQIVKNPKPGDIVFFKYSTNNRRTNHVGIVVSASGKIINTIEGNTSVKSQDNGGCVMQRNRTSNIVAYARPKYDGLVSTPVEKTGRDTLRVGSKGNDVLYLHKQLKKLKYGVDTNSNYFDATTKICVINFQATHNLEPDGIVGKKTWAEIDKIV